MDLQVKIYSTPGCRACAALKQEMTSSEFAEYVDHIDITEDAESLNLLKSNGIMSAPTIGVFFNNEWNFLVGMRPAKDVDKFIKESME